MRKKSISMLLVVICILTLSLGTVVSASSTNITTSGGTAGATVKYRQSSNYIIALPAIIDLGTDKLATVTATAPVLNIAPQQTLKITMDSTDMDSQGYLKMPLVGLESKEIYTKVLKGASGSAVLNKGGDVAVFTNATGTPTESVGGIRFSGTYKDTTGAVTDATTAAGDYSTNIIFTATLNPNY